MAASEGSSRAGLVAAAGAFVAWGLMPVYWKSLHPVAPFEVLCHRVVWSTVFLSLVIGLQGGWRGLASDLRTPRALKLSVLSGAVIGGNWLLYIWAINSGHVLESSLGYYINPLLNVLLGCAFFGERLRRLQVVALLLAGAGVASLTFGYGQFPWIGLTLAFSFALYGALRKMARTGAVPGQWIETVFLALPAAAYLLWLQRADAGAFLAGETSLSLLLAASGAVTSLPLLGFAFGVQRLRLSTVGILQYIAPTLNFVLGVFLYREPFTPSHLAAFGCIWLGVAAYAAEALWEARRLDSTPTEA